MPYIMRYPVHHTVRYTVRYTVRFLLLLSLFSFFHLALAVTINVDAGENGRLEIRSLTLPDGTESEIYVLSGDPVRLRFEGGLVEADVIEWDRNNNLLRIVGFGRYVSESVTTTGEDFVVDLNTERFRASEVVLVTEAIDIYGVEVTRFPGQLDVASGVFSPCGRCGQEPEDYGFKAETMRLYPGDRLVAYNVTVLIRGAAVFTLPLLVFPLGPPERRPRLDIIQGTETERAEVALDWPYTAGANAFGYASLRYFADVTPGTGNIFTENILGGGVDENYLGGGFLHRYFTDEGAGRLDFNFRPRFRGATDELDEREQFTLRWRHDTFAELERPRVSILFERDDARRQRLSEYSFGVEQVIAGLSVRFLTQGYLDHEPALGLRLPSYTGRGVPERTYAQVNVSGAEGLSFSAGPFVLSGVEVDLGMFEAASNRLNRSALARGPRLSEGRLLQRSNLRLNPVTPWAGLSIDGSNAFLGQYYTTGERAVAWDSRLNLRQDFGLGTFNVTFARTTTEGETPFDFDALIPAGRTDLLSSLSLSPAGWLSLDVRGGYVFVDTRRPDAAGFAPLETALTLFGDQNWISLAFRNSYDLQEGNPGELRADLVLNAEPVRLELNHLQDLDPRPLSRRSDEAVDLTRSALRLDVGLAPYLQVEARTGYTYAPPEPAEDGVFEFWDPLRAVVTTGTIEQTDGVPGARLSYERDLNRGEVTDLGLELAASYDAFEVYLRQEMDFVTPALSSRYVLSWRNVVEFEATGFALAPLSWFGLEAEANQNWAFQLRDLGQFAGVEAWRLRYSTTFNPTLLRADGGLGGFQGSRLDAFANLQQGEVGPLVFSVDFAANVLVADDALAISYLQSANLTLSAQLAERVGLQGRLRYRGISDGTQVTSSLLELADVALTARVLDDLYVATVFNDLWDFSGTDPERTPFNLQPVVHVIWDRCCWALYSSLDTATGRFSLGIGMPGSSEDVVQGFQQDFDTGIRLPGRE